MNNLEAVVKPLIGIMCRPNFSSTFYPSKKKKKKKKADGRGSSKKRSHTVMSKEKDEETRWLDGRSAGGKSMVQ